ncbi:hypothetical protein ACKLNR_003359 [Fusarium oxysporum f. sp. zingiberi]
MNKARKRKWLVEKSDIKKLQQRMCQAKETLHFALNSSRVSNDIRFQAEIRQIMMNMQTMHTSSPSPPLQVPQLPEIIESPAPVQQLQDDHTPESDAVVMNNGHDSNLKHMNGSVQINSVVSTQRIPSDSYSLYQQLYSSLEALLDIWKNILTEVGLPRRVAMAAAISLRDYELNYNETYLVKNVLGFSRDPTEAATTKVHEAILQCADLQEVLQEQPWAVNTIDDTGDSPLYLATDKKDGHLSWPQSGNKTSSL